MEISTLIIIGIVIFVVIRLFTPVNPASKTDDQLRMMYNLAMKQWNPMYPKNSDHLRIEEEMIRRGLLPKNADDENMSPEVQEAIRQVEESGFLEGMKELAEEEIPEKIFNKTIEIARAKGISEEEASNYFTSKFEELSKKYIESGDSQLEADKKAMYEALSMPIE